MVKRFDNYLNKEVDVELAGPNPTSAPPVDPSFLYHLARISARLGQEHRPKWNQRGGHWDIQVRTENGEYVTVFAAYDEVRAWEGNMYPYMPLDMRVIDEFANSCLELKYDTKTIEEARHLDELAREAIAEREEARESEQQAQHIQHLIGQGICGVYGDNSRARRFLEHARSDGGKFKEFHQVPRATGGD